MNRVFRIIFNHRLGIFQCVSELARSGGKGRKNAVNKKPNKSAKKSILAAFPFLSFPFLSFPFL